MNKKSKLLSLLMALAISASAFTGLVIPASAENNTVSATLVHTASAKGGSNEAGQFLDAETHYYNNWGTGESGWYATAYSDFTFADGALPTDKDMVVSAVLTTYANSASGTRVIEAGMVSAADIGLDLSGATAAECTIPMITRPQGAVSQSTAAGDLAEKTFDVTGFVKSMIENGDSEIVFAYGGGAAGGNIAGKGDADKQPTLVVTTLPDTAVKKTITVNYKDTDDKAVAETVTAQIYESLEFTPEYEASFVKDGYIYTYKEGGDKITVTGDATINIVYEKTEVKTSGVFLEETFEDYEAKAVIASGKTEAPKPVTLGNIIYAAGNRTDGMTCTATITEDNSNKYLFVDSDGYATSNRGISFTFSESAGIPKVEDIADEDNDILELSMEVEGTQPFNITGFGEIPAVAKASGGTSSGGTSGGAKAVITPTKSAENGIVIKAVYEGAALKSMTSEKVTNVTAGTPIEVSASKGTVVMLWDSLNNMEPLAEPAESEEIPVISISKSGMNVVKAIIDKANKQQYLMVLKPNGDVISSTVAELTATGFTGATFYNANADVKLDNIKVEKKAADVGVLNITVKNSSDTAVADATINVAGMNYKTDANGVVKVALPNGEYTVTASKSGYEHTAGMQDNDTKTVTVNSNTQTVDMSLSEMSYIKIVDTGSLKGGQLFIAAPKTAEPSVTAAFTTEVADQYGIIMEDGTYSIAWKVIPLGTTEPDNNVTISNDGIVSVAQTFTAGEGKNIAPYEVVATVVSLEDEGLFSIELKKTLYVGTNDVIYYEEPNWSQPGGSGNRGGSMNFANNITVSDIISFTMNVQFPTGTDGQTTLMLKSDKGNLVGIQLQSNNKINVGTGWKGNSAYNQSGDTDQFTTLGGTLVTDYNKEKAIDVTFVIDKENKTITASCGTETIPVTYTDDITTLTGLAFGQYRNYGAVKVNSIAVREPDSNYLAVSGDINMAKVSGQTVTRSYALAQSVIVPDETFSFAVTPAEQGVTISNDGVLSIADNTTPGKYTITATSTVNAEKTGSLEVDIKDFQKIEKSQMTVVGPQAYQLGKDTEGTYAITNIVDSCDDNVTDIFPKAVWTSSDANVVTITADGKLTVVGAGSTKVTATITNGTAVSTLDIPVTVSKYYVTANATGNSTAIDTTGFITNDKIKGYQVTTSKDGKLVKQNVVATLPTSVDSTGADKVEVAPVFECENITSSASVTVDVPVDTYNFDISNASGAHFDPYVNEQMLANNMLQGGSNVAQIAVNDIFVKEGYVTLILRDASSDSKAGKITFVKAPSIVERTKKVYVLGDSLVCIYDTGGSAENPTAQTGWGQVLADYMKNVDVVDLANSGSWAAGLETSAFTQIAESGKEGDILLLESAYNDEKHGNTAVMNPALTRMNAVASAKGVDVIFVTPNASTKPYRSTPGLAGAMKELAKELEVKCLDLGTLSFEFMLATHGGEANQAPDAIMGTYTISDGLHSNYRGANKWASIVASELIGMGYGDYVDTTHAYTFTASDGKTVTCQAK